MNASTPDDELKRVLLENARLQLQVLRWLVNIGWIAVALVGVLVIVYGGGWLADQVGS